MACAAVAAAAAAVNAVSSPLHPVIATHPRLFSPRVSCLVHRAAAADAIAVVAAAAAVEPAACLPLPFYLPLFWSSCHFTLAAPQSTMTPTILLIKCTGHCILSQMRLSTVSVLQEEAATTSVDACMCACFRRQK